MEDVLFTLAIQKKLQLDNPVSFMLHELVVLYVYVYDRKSDPDAKVIPCIGKLSLAIEMQFLQIIVSSLENIVTT